MESAVLPRPAYVCGTSVIGKAKGNYIQGHRMADL